LAQLIRVVRQGADSNELISFEEMFDIEESVPTEEIYDGEWEKSLVEQKTRGFRNQRMWK
jgi:hypothetical protein